MANQEEPIKVTDDFKQCWQSAGRHLQSQVEGGLTWMRASLDEPFMDCLLYTSSGFLLDAKVSYFFVGESLLVPLKDGSVLEFES